jgi:hypothetical protein
LLSACYLLVELLARVLVVVLTLIFRRHISRRLVRTIDVLEQSSCMILAQGGQNWKTGVKVEAEDAIPGGAE